MKQTIGMLQNQAGRVSCFEWHGMAPHVEYILPLWHPRRIVSKSQGCIAIQVSSRAQVVFAKRGTCCNTVLKDEKHPLSCVCPSRLQRVSPEVKAKEAELAEAQRVTGRVKERGCLFGGV